MLRDEDNAERRVEKLERINAALIRRLERFEESRGPAYALSRAAAVLEREVMTRNRDLEAALTELAQINTELAHAREVADQANRAKSRFLRAASHDLLQPLSAAKLFLSHLHELSTDAMQRDLVSHLTATIDSAEELIRALSNIAKLDSRSFRTNLAPIAMGRLFRRLIIDTQPLAASRGVDLRFVATAATVLSDGVFLRQIMQNLITNALKYTTGRKVLVGLRHDSSDEENGPTVWLEVLDQGPGIAPKDQPLIFNEFERLSHAKQPGTGLGLSIVQRACEQLGHRLELISIPGKGSRFRVQLPLVQSLPISLAAERAIRRESHSNFARKRILLIENDPAVRHAFELVLTNWGCEVQAVSGIEQARDSASLITPDLVLTDFRLDGDETGIQALRALIKDFGRELPAVIVSAESAAAIREEAVGLKVAILEKPVADQDLRRAMQQALDPK